MVDQEEKSLGELALFAKSKPASAESLTLFLWLMGILCSTNDTNPLSSMISNELAMAAVFIFWDCLGWRSLRLVHWVRCLLYDCGT